MKSSYVDKAKTLFTASGKLDLIVRYDVVRFLRQKSLIDHFKHGFRTHKTA